MRGQRDRGLKRNSRFCHILRFTQVVLVGLAISIPLDSQEAMAQAKSNEQIAQIAQSITVRIEGASTPASGVLIQREGSRYTVLTAWHVVSTQNPEEELAIYTSDGRQHQLERGSIERVGNVDLAVLRFTSSNQHEIARQSTAKPRTGANIYLYGYPATTTSVPMRIPRGTSGEIVGASGNESLKGYELMYSTQMPSMTGMSGGPVLDRAGNLIGIHSRSETDQTQSVEEGVVIRTGMSQGVPVSYFVRRRSPRAVMNTSPVSAAPRSVLEPLSPVKITPRRIDQTLEQRYRDAIRPQQEWLRRLQGR